MKKAVIVTDVQNKIFNSSPKPYKADDVIEKINMIIKKARNTGNPVIFLQHEAPQFLEFNSDGWPLHESIGVEPTDYRIRKSTGDAFLGTDLEETLKGLNIRHIIICGYASEFCIDSTTRRAAGLGYNIELISDAHTTHDKQHLSGEQIRNHHNVTLSMGPTINAISSSDVIF